MGRACSTIVNDCPETHQCVSKGGPDGICSTPCTSFADCPAFWSCDEIGVQRYCFPP
jgi:hypothetical protein